jgi:hypothetical protein
MTVLRNTTQDESAKLELLGAETRLERGLRSLCEFQRLHGTFDADDKFSFLPGNDADLLESLRRELMGLQIELDDAARGVAHARAQVAQTLPAK